LIFEFSDRMKDLERRLETFMDEQVYPKERRFYDEIETRPWTPMKVLEHLKRKARAEGLWNLFLPESEYGAGLTNTEYAPLCEIMGRSPMAAECSTARHRTPLTGRYWHVTAPPSRADGPHEVHIEAIAKQDLRKWPTRVSPSASPCSSRAQLSE